MGIPLEPFIISAICTSITASIFLTYNRIKNQKTVDANLDNSVYIIAPAFERCFFWAIHFRK